jgi:hypothetical protein
MLRHDLWGSPAVLCVVMLIVGSTQSGSAIAPTANSNAGLDGDQGVSPTRYWRHQPKTRSFRTTFLQPRPAVEQDYFAVVSSCLLIVVRTLVAERDVELQLGEDRGKVPAESGEDVSWEEARGPRFALNALVARVAGIALLTFPAPAALWDSVVSRLGIDTDGCTGQGHQEDHADQRAPERSGGGSTQPRGPIIEPMLDEIMAFLNYKNREYSEGQSQHQG